MDLDLIDIEDPIEQYDTMSRVTQTAERPGFDSIWLFNHVHACHTPVLETTFKCWTSTAALARDTSRIRLGQMTTGTPTAEHIAGSEPRSHGGFGPVPDRPGLGIEVDMSGLGTPLVTIVDPA